MRVWSIKSIGHNCSRYHSVISSIINIAIHLPGHDNHPQKENNIYQFKRKSRSPAVTYHHHRVSTSITHSGEKKKGGHTNSNLRQPSQSLNILPTQPIPIHLIPTPIINAPDDAVHLQRGFDETREPEDEEDEAADDDQAGEEEALGGQD